MSESFTYDDILSLKWTIEQGINDIVALLRKTTAETWRENWQNAIALFESAFTKMNEMRGLFATINNLLVTKPKEEKKEKEEPKEVKESGVHESDKHAKKDKRKAKE